MDFPVDILLDIVVHLPLHDVLALRRVCSLFRCSSCADHCVDVKVPLHCDAFARALGSSLSHARPRQAYPLPRHAPRRPLCPRPRIPHLPRPRPPSHMDIPTARPPQAPHLQYPHRTHRAHHISPVLARPIKSLAHLSLSHSSAPEHLPPPMLGCRPRASYLCR